MNWKSDALIVFSCGVNLVILLQIIDSISYIIISCKGSSLQCYSDEQFAGTKTENTITFERSTAFEKHQ